VKRGLVSISLGEEFVGFVVEETLVCIDVGGGISRANVSIGIGGVDVGRIVCAGVGVRVPCGVEGAVVLLGFIVSNEGEIILVRVVGSGLIREVVGGGIEGVDVRGFKWEVVGGGLVGTNVERSI
jgi:hypothetical protein